MSPSIRLWVRGLSLVEVSVYCGLLTLLLGGIYLLLVGGLRYFRAGEAHERLLQEAAVCLQRMSSELANTDPETLEPPPPDGGQAFILFLSPEAPYPGPSGQWTWVGGTDLEWKKWVCYYLDQGGLVWRSEKALTSPAVVPPVPNSPGPATMEALQIPPQALLAHGVQALNFEQCQDGLVITLSVSQALGSQACQATTLSLVTRVCMENRKS